MNDASLVDQVLVKDKFTSELSAQGMTSEEVGVEWEKLVKLYEVALGQVFYEVLPEEGKKEALAGVADPKKIESAKQVFENLIKLMQSGRFTVDKGELTQKAVVLAYQNYLKSKGDELLKEK